MKSTAESYVTKGTQIVNIILLLCHLFFAYIFYSYDATIMFWFNCFSIVTYLVGFEVLRRRKAWVYVIMVYAELFLFMTIAVVCLGWEWGFQQYCIGFAASIAFTDYYMNKDHMVGRKTYVFVAVDVLVYLILRMWTYFAPYVYEIPNELLVKSYYIINTMIGFSFLVLYLCIYANTVNRYSESLLDMANTDPLTKIYNRGKMQQILKESFNENLTDELAIAMLDVDDFKKINDTYGHDAGDEVLRKLASVLREKQKKNSNIIVSRWGGEEFLVLCNRIEKKEDIVREFDGLRESVQNMLVDSNGLQIKITITIGLAFSNEVRDLNATLKLADNNLYKGKNSGKNTVIA